MMKQLLVLMLVGILLTGCATWKNDRSETATENSPPASASLASDESRLVARDFVNAFQQLETMEPAETTVHLASGMSSDAFTGVMHDALVQAGYGIRWVVDASSKNYLHYRKEIAASDRLTRREEYRVAIGAVEMRRTYVTDVRGSIRPQTPLYIRGADATAVILNDDIFGISLQKTKLDNDTGVATRRTEATPSVSREPLASPVTNQATSQADADTTKNRQNRSEIPTGLRPSAGASLSTSTSANQLSQLPGASLPAKPITMPLMALPRVDNVFDLGSSNFENLLAGYEIVAEQILLFANDSLRLGDANKRLVERLVGRFNEQTDVFSVLGCSVGPTRISGGNAALALGRANRVIEALLFAGVSKNSILDEGCWASQSVTQGVTTGLPARGVVITLNRRMN